MAARPQAEPSLSLPKRYTNAHILGVGAFGRVFKAHDSVRNLDLALKVVGPDEAAWLLREFDTLRQIRQENLIRVFDWGTLPSGDAYYTMELVEGGDWGAEMGKPQSAERTTTVLQGVGRALAHLHSHGEIHGDLKPANVLLGAGSVVKLTDVGMGTAARAEQSVSGTPGYAAPEIWEGAAGDVRSDIYSVGVMAYEAVTGRHPFLGKTIKDVVSGQLEGWVASPRAHGVSVPAPLERAIMRTLERNPALRHGSVDEFLEDLGIEDRVGEILGGKIVGRDAEIAELDRLLGSKDVSAPTLVQITGPPGIGKTSVVEEFAQRVLAKGGSVLRPRVHSAQGVADALSHSEAAGSSAQSSDNPTLLSVSDALARASHEAPVVVYLVTPQGEDKRALDFARSLARYLWAIALESDRRAPLLVCLEHETPPGELEEFESHIPVNPLDQSGTEHLIEGTLGRTHLEPEVSRRIHAVAGGSPGGVRALLADLIGNGHLQRFTGTWRFREVGRLSDLTLSGAATRWALAWGRLSSEQRAVLGLLSHLPNGIVGTALERALPGRSGLLPELASRGWVRQSVNLWMLAAEEVRAAIGDLASNDESNIAEQRILGDPQSGLSREERASLLLRVGPAETALEEGLWAAEQAAGRGEHSVARDRAERSLRIAESSDDALRAQRASLVLGESLHQMARDEEAEEVLRREGVWSRTPPETQVAARRSYLLGTVNRARGRVSEARTFLTSAISIAEKAGDLPILLRAQADLAEIDWWHGDELTKEASVERIRTTLARDFGDHTLNDERAALAYQLGSALILSGRREQALDVLEQGLALEPGDFWRMKLSNARASALFYLGNFEEALSWLDDAWRCAERGGVDAFKARILANRAGIFYGLGRFQEAVETHRVSAQWGRRTGNTAEFITAKAGESINLTLLGRYDHAIEAAEESHEGSLRIGSMRDAAKALELKALATYLIGDYLAATDLIEMAMKETEGSGFDDVRPRLDWLKGRLLVAAGDLSAAGTALQSARDVLTQTKDWEDLPGVQIELQMLLFRKQDPGFRLDEIKRLAWDADEHRARIVYLHGALAVAEVVLTGGANDGKDREFLLDALARAEESGAAEFSWRLSQVLGEFACRDGDMRGASARYAHSLRRFREIADHLTPSHKRFYLSTAHATRFLKRAAELNS